MMNLIRVIAAAITLLAATAGGAVQPNILWLSSEDNGPHLGCYGDEFADTPNLDALAARGMRYVNAWSTAPVCAPARTTIITGVYPPSTGSQHMRSEAPMPPWMKMFPQYLREAGYYCTNNSKEDYNLIKPEGVWDVSSRAGHWKNRPEGSPFFAVFNETISHESQIRTRPHEAVHDPAGVRVPAYHPDTPEVRQDWAQYYDRVTEMDAIMGRHLRELEDAGLAEDTIVFYWGDHGSGMPRNKRWTYQSGLHVPLIVHVPEKFLHLAPGDYAAGGESARLVGFIDLAPTMLSLCGIEPPEWMQGGAFMGEYDAAPAEFLFGFRDRMDERIDFSRSVRDGEYVYIRNYMPHRPQGQHLSYMFRTPTTAVWHEMFLQGKLNEAQAFFWKPKPPEELYYLPDDHDEVVNLVDDSRHAEALERLRRAHLAWGERVRDLSFLPESEMHRRSADMSPYEAGHDPDVYDFESVRAAARIAAARDSESVPRLIRLLSDDDPAVRYWAATGLLIRGAEAVAEGRDKLLAALRDDSGAVRVVAAEAVGKFTDGESARLAVETLLELADVERNPFFLCVEAMNALDELDDKAAWAVERIRTLPIRHEKIPKRTNDYLQRLREKTLADLGVEDNGR